MEYFDVFFKPEKDDTPLVLVIGKFDGIHKGHVALLEYARSLSQHQLAVMSFSQHPYWVLKQDAKYREPITPLAQKLSLLQKLGVDRFYNIQFTKEYASISAEQFVKEHLGQLNVKTIVVGEDFHFGKKGVATVADLATLSVDRQINVVGIPLIKENNEKISSTLIRQHIMQGKVEEAHHLLGRPFTVTGTVVHGEALGRELGFPTLNLGGEISNYILPSPGVYLGKARIVDNNEIIERYTLISTGYRPTVDDSERYLVEAYLLDFSGDLYDRYVELDFHSYLRPELKFDGLDTLIEQMKIDEINARELIGIKELTL